MSKKQDFLAALSGEQPAGAVPIWEIEFQAWDAASGRHVVLGKEFERLSPDQQERAMHLNAEILLEVCREFHFAALSAPSGYWEQAPGQLAYYVMPGDTRYRQFEILRKLAGDDLALVGSTWAVIGGSYNEDFCEKLFYAPEAIEEWTRQVLADGIAATRRYADLGADAVFTASDIADNSGPFYNPQQMRRFILPNLNQWAEAAHAMGLKTILHSDGQLTPYLNDIADTAVDALQAVDPTAGMDMAEAKRIVAGRLCLCGNIDCGLLLTAAPQRVYDATARLLQECKAGGGLVLGTSNAVQPEVPMVNYRAMLEAWKTFGTYARP